MKKITKIESQKKRQNRVSIFLDNTFFCGISQKLLLKLDLYEGKEVDEEEIRGVIEEKETEDAKQKVLRLFNRRIYSEKEIREKLKKKGYEDETIRIVVQDLKEISFINDYSFTKAFVSDRLRLNPKGSFQISYELKQKGINQTIINKVFDEEKVIEGDSDRAFEIARKRLETLKSIGDKKTKKRRLYNFLLRRGFSYEVIKGVLDELL
ncbi:RecX family transcriptional regulator [candidate division WOR-3 bacterium]|nr:RecX family transcriptional regulator [candidate division WOR-3 bacterium]